MSDLVERLKRRAETLEALGSRDLSDEKRRTLAWQIEAAASMFHAAKDSTEAADEITRLQKELETAREALEDIARQRLPVEIDDDLDPDFPTGYEGCILRARIALQKKEATE